MPSSRPSESSGGKTTSLSLLARVRASDESAWDRLVHIYSPLVTRWCRKWALQADDVSDISQEVFAAVARGIEKFRRDRPGDSFRGWLWGITSNKVKDHYRRLNRNAQPAGGSTANAALLQLPEVLPHDEDEESLSAPDSPLNRALELIRIEFEDRTWQAFWAVAVDGRVPADVAADFGMERMAVYKAKSRVMAKLRAELDGLVDF